MHNLFVKSKLFFSFLFITCNFLLDVEHLIGDMFESLPRAEAILLKVGLLLLLLFN